MISEKAGPAGGLAGTLITLRTRVLKREFSIRAAEYRGSIEIQGSVCHQPLPPPQVMLVVKICLPMQEMQETVSIPGSGKSLGVGKWQSTIVFVPGKFHRQRSLVGYSPWGLTKSQVAIFFAKKCSAPELRKRASIILAKPQFQLQLEQSQRASPRRFFCRAFRDQILDLLK